MADVWEVLRRGLGAPVRVKEDAVEMEVDEDPAVDELAKLEGEEDEDSSAEDGEDHEPVASTSTQLATAPASAPLTTAAPIKTFTLPPNLRTTPQTRRLLGSAFAFLVRKARSAPSGQVEVEGELEQLMRMMVEDVVEVEEADEGQRSSRGRGAKGRGKGAGKGRGQEEGSSNILAEGVTWVVVETCSVSVALAFGASTEPNR